MRALRREDWIWGLHRRRGSSGELGEVRRAMLRVNGARLGLHRWTSASLLSNGRFAAGEGSASWAFCLSFSLPLSWVHGWGSVA
jgi:hypothetical protein